MKPTLEMLLGLCSEDTRQTFIQHCDHNEIQNPTAKDFEDLEVILQKARYALTDLGGATLVGEVADDMGAALARFVTWPKIGG